MSSTADLKSRLKQLRDKLALETPRARSRPSVSPELVGRLEATLKIVSDAYLVASSSSSAESIQDACEDAIAEGHLVLHDWERLLDQRKDTKPTVPMRVLRGTERSNRRAHDREEIDVSVQISRYGVRDNAGSLSVESAVVNRPARNVSVGGIFVAVPQSDLPQVGVGTVVHLSVKVEGLTIQARAAVTRRDGEGIALRWIQESAQAQRVIESLLDALRRGRAHDR